MIKFITGFIKYWKEMNKKEEQMIKEDEELERKGYYEI